MSQNSNRLYHHLRQPIAAIMNFSGAGARMADNGADHAALKNIFMQIEAEAERLGEICKLQENSNNRGEGEMEQ